MTAAEPSQSAGDHANAVLVVRPSSLGDIVYALAIATDIRRARPELAIDWVSEPGFAPLIAMCADVRNVISFGLRRWRRAPLRLATWRDMSVFRRVLRSTRYAAILDLQEQVKGALIARLARGRRHGFDRASIREPLATLGDDVHHRVPRNLHFLARCRRLAGAALDYAVDDAPRWNLRPPQSGLAIPDRPYVVVLHATSRDDKLWPEAHWRAVIDASERAGFATVLPWGSATEEARSRRLAAGFGNAVVPRWLSLPAMSAMPARRLRRKPSSRRRASPYAGDRSCKTDDRALRLHPPLVDRAAVPAAAPVVARTPRAAVPLTHRRALRTLRRRRTRRRQ